MIEERVILGWNEDRSGKVFRLCKKCGCYQPVEKFNNSYANVCRDCYNEEQREKYRKSIEDGAAPEGLPLCRNCRSFSPHKREWKGVPESGWCMRRKMSVYGSSECALHRFPLNGKFQEIAIATR